MKLNTDFSALCKKTKIKKDANKAKFKWQDGRPGALGWWWQQFCSQSQQACWHKYHIKVPVIGVYRRDPPCHNKRNKNYFEASKTRYFQLCLATDTTQNARISWQTTPLNMREKSLRRHNGSSTTQNPMLAPLARSLFGDKTNPIWIEFLSKPQKWMRTPVWEDLLAPTPPPESRPPGSLPLLAHRSERTALFVPTSFSKNIAPLAVLAFGAGYGVTEQICNR